MSTLSEMHSGYKGNAEKWQNFLLSWSNKRQELALEGSSVFVVHEVNEHIIKQDIYDTEERLGFKLPKSYCDFMLATEGKVPYWFFESYSQYGKMLSLQEINKVKLIEPELVGYEKNDLGDLYQYLSFEDVDNLFERKEEYYRYDSSQEAVYIKQIPEMFLLNLTDPDQGILLLNSEEKTKDGELQGYLLDHKALGAYRFTSFAQMIVCIYLREIINDSNNCIGWADYHNDPYGIARLLFE